VTLYAKWVINSYTISFNTNGGTAVPSITQNYGTSIATAPITTKPGYTFAGWYSDVGLTTAVTFPYTITSSATIYAKWNSAPTQLELSITENQTYLICLNAQNKASFTGETYTLTYDSSKIQLVDVCALTHTKETTAGIIAGTGITIINCTPGQITFTVTNMISSGSSWSGVINIFEFKAKTSGVTTLSLLS
jgi:uncharacterized repeat protein (TIGR02543 family)